MAPRGETGTGVAAGVEPVSDQMASNGRDHQPMLRKSMDVESDSSEVGLAEDDSSSHPQRLTAQLVLLWLKKNKWIFIFFIFFFLLSLAACFIAGYFTGQGAKDCGSPPSRPGWILYNDQSYYYSEEKLDWLSSKKFCEKHGARLAVLKNDSIKENVIRFKKHSDDHWFGCYKTEDGRKWLDKSSLEDESLNSISGLNCITWNPSEQWEADCSQKKPFICISSQ
ncbi:C-type lectin domain family 2 member L-like [Mantella aurantiaca]